MYKKITHHITEEHFAHPDAAKIKKVVESTKKKPDMKTKGFYLINDNECYGLDNFEKHNIHAWTALATRLHDLVVSVSSASPDAADLNNLLTNDITRISKMIEPIA